MPKSYKEEKFRDTVGIDCVTRLLPWNSLIENQVEGRRLKFKNCQEVHWPPKRLCDFAQEYII